MYIPDIETVILEDMIVKLEEEGADSLVEISSGTRYNSISAENEMQKAVRALA